MYIFQLNAEADKFDNSTLGLAELAEDQIRPDTAELRYENVLSPQEKAYLDDRNQKMEETVKSFLNKNISETTNNKVPRIAICISGGGIRAMLGTVAVFNALKKFGLFDGISHISALSGSTWCLSTWLASLVSEDEKNPFVSGPDPNVDIWTADLSQHEQPLNVDMNIQKALDKVQSGTVASLSYASTWPQIASAVRKAVFKGRPVSLVDIYGVLLAKQLLEEHTTNRHDIPLHSLRRVLEKKDGVKVPYPICTAVTKTSTNGEYEWLEFTPYEVGYIHGPHVPAEAFGMYFSHGKLGGITFYQNRPEHLSYLQAIWGSAFACDIKGIYEAYVRDKLHAGLKWVLNRVEIGRAHV